MELYKYARPDLMSGKKILFIHGFASSGSNGTVSTLRLILPNAEVIAPDLPVEPFDAMELLKKICSEQQPDLIIGTSMGGMYAEQLYGYDRILVNPAFSLAQNLLKSNSMGRQQFHSERQDGQKDFLVTKSLVDRYGEVCAQCFKGVSSLLEQRNDDERERVWGLFGRHDPFVHTFPEFSKYYSKAIYFEGEHYLNDSVFLHSVLPLIQRIDDRQEGRKRSTILINLDGALIPNLDLDMHLDESDHQNSKPELLPVSASQKAVRELSQTYDVYILCDLDNNYSSNWGTISRWVDLYFGVPVWNRHIFISHKDILLFDYLIDMYPSENGGDDFMGTTIQFGSDTFKNWDDILEFYSRLGGQS